MFLSFASIKAIINKIKSSTILHPQHPNTILYPRYKIEFQDRRVVEKDYNQQYNFFNYLTVNARNSLPDEIVATTTTNVLKKKVR